ncbi:unnamed protein product, partial [Acidithrix sp. C25]
VNKTTYNMRSLGLSSDRPNPDAANHRSMAFRQRSVARIESR